jgi:hydrogenase maturation factor
VSLRAGKLPPDVLEPLLAGLANGPRTIIGPAIGRDAAALDAGSDSIVVAASDPITFATEDAGWYAVHVNANDVACMGVRPAWFLATVLLPEGGADDLATRIFEQMTAACGDVGAHLVGGHTEVTAGIDRPIIAGTMLGTGTRERLITGEGIEPGDVILLLQPAAIEGTALLAVEAKDALRERGVADAVMERAARLLFVPGISIVTAAHRLCAALRPRLLHDPTEGGIATAVEEMARAANATLCVDPGKIEILAETRIICDALGLDALGLLASGALLAIVPAAHADAAAAAARNVTISCKRLGSVEAGPPRVIMVPERRPLPRYERDELARYFSRREA